MTRLPPRLERSLRSERSDATSCGFPSFSQVRQDGHSCHEARHTFVGGVQSPLLETLCPLMPVLQERCYNGTRGSAEQGDENKAQEPKVTYSDNHGLWRSVQTRMAWAAATNSASVAFTRSASLRFGRTPRTNSVPERRRNGLDDYAPAL